MRQQTYGTIFYPPLTNNYVFVVTLIDIKNAIKKTGKEKERKKIRRNTTKENKRQEK
jgi:hypothetical protein